MSNVAECAHTFPFSSRAATAGQISGNVGASPTSDSAIPLMAMLYLLNEHSGLINCEPLATTRPSRTSATPIEQMLARLLAAV